MVVLRRTSGGSYILAELDGSISRLRFAAFRLVPYYLRDICAIPVTKITDTSPEALDDYTYDVEPSAETGSSTTSLLSANLYHTPALCERQPFTHSTPFQDTDREVSILSPREM